MQTDPRPSVIVYGPQGCGKTRYSKLIMQALGLQKVIEADELHGRPMPKHRALVLTNERPPASHRGPVMSFDQAMNQVYEMTGVEPYVPCSLGEGASAS